MDASMLLVVRIKPPYTKGSIQDIAEEIAKLTREHVDIYDGEDYEVHSIYDCVPAEE